MIRTKARSSFIGWSVVLTFGVLGAARAAYGQTVEQRLNDTLNEITILKRVIAEQDRRISQLEKAVEALRAGSAADKGQTGAASEPAKSKTSKALWQDPAAWGKVQEGMTEEQVVALLGKPTSVESEASYRVLIYETKKAMGAGALSGKVKLLDGRVWLIESPIFF